MTLRNYHLMGIPTGYMGNLYWLIFLYKTNYVDSDRMRAEFMFSSHCTLQESVERNFSSILIENIPIKYNYSNIYVRVFHFIMLPKISFDYITCWHHL